MAWLSAHETGACVLPTAKAPQFYRVALHCADPGCRVPRSRSGFIVDYVEDTRGRRLGAVRLGDVRLIDNVTLGDRS